LSPLERTARARRLYLHVSRKVDGILHGEHLGVLPGSGGEPADARLYLPGDDVRRLDWAVLARTGVPHVRTTTAERELDTTFVADLSASMTFGTRGQDKRTLALTAVAAFCHLGSGPGDRLAALVLTERGLRRIPPRPARTAGPQLLSVLDRAVARDGVAPPLAQALRAVPTTRRGVVVVVTDLLGGTAAGAEPSWQAPLRLLARRHDVVVVEIIDPRELALPAVGLLRVVDPETGRQLDVPTGSRRLRERYAAAARARRSAHADAVRAAGAAHLPMRTDGDWLRELSAFLAVRRRVRRNRPAGAM
jgi:uncharacterized protein (DUF58 family)